MPHGVVNKKSIAIALIMATLLVGNSGYGGIRRILNENGSDGTVRVSIANLNAACANFLASSFPSDGSNIVL